MHFSFPAFWMLFTMNRAAVFEIDPLFLQFGILLPFKHPPELPPKKI